MTDPSERSAAEPLVSALDFRGRPPGARQRGKLLALVAAALNSGWTEQDLKTYLDLGGAAVNSAAAVYVHRLTPGELPDPDTYREAVSRPLEGTDAAVAGWMALAGQSGSHTPYRDDTWARLDRDAKEGRRPAGWETVPWCGSCDEITRAREETEDGRTVPRLCGGCHPMMRF
ncbi:hypothetical protein ACIOEX_01415 [Streptomyces sp. NPDC087850]|uniref:hypothetical protein n=1 Tax=Streptomyces sp. NPDC087850 TaxID=3365809 RepID=UPI00380E9E23